MNVAQNEKKQLWIEKKPFKLINDIRRKKPTKIEEKELDNRKLTRYRSRKRFINLKEMKKWLQNKQNKQISEFF